MDICTLLLNERNAHVGRVFVIFPFDVFPPWHAF